jgi:PRTRC genetic system protein E
MFKELAPILEKRALTVTVARLPKSNLICVTVVPTQIDGDKDIDKAILEPLKLDPATAEDLDAGLAEALTSHTTTFLSMQESVDQAKAQMEAALQAAKDEAKKKADEAKKKVSTTGKAVTHAKAPEPPKPEPPKPPSLFDGPAQADAPAAGVVSAQPQPSPAPTEAVSAPVAAAPALANPADADSLFPSIQSTEDEILAEVNADHAETEDDSIAA